VRPNGSGSGAGSDGGHFEACRAGFTVRSGACPAGGRPGCRWRAPDRRGSPRRLRTAGRAPKWSPCAHPEDCGPRPSRHAPANPGPSRRWNHNCQGRHGSRDGCGSDNGPASPAGNRHHAGWARPAPRDRRCPAAQSSPHLDAGNSRRSVARSPQCSATRTPPRPAAQNPLSQPWSALRLARRPSQQGPGWEGGEDRKDRVGCYPPRAPARSALLGTRFGSPRSGAVFQSRRRDGRMARPAGWFTNGSTVKVGTLLKVGRQKPGPNLSRIVRKTPSRPNNDQDPASRRWLRTTQV
jgi:hypothetical protein